MKTKLMAVLLLAGSSVFAQHIRVGVGIGLGGPRYYPTPGYYASGYYYAPPPRVAYGPAYYSPVYPAPDYTWVEGYRYHTGPRYGWRPGYSVRPPYAYGYRVAPRYSGRGYNSGYRHR